MKRYAAHYLYGPAGACFKQAVVEMENDTVFSFFPLTEEVHSASWLGGVILLSDKKDYRWSGNLSLPEMVSFLVEKANEKAPLYAYHIDRIDFQTKMLWPDATVCRL